jgi:transcriptional regulator with XRE-family HTH domain
VIVNLTKRLFEKLSRKKYRDAYVAENVRTGIAYQIRALREQRGWNQGRFSAELGKPQSVTSRLENPDYGKLSIKSLLEVASAFDVALVIKYVNFPEFLRQTRDVSTESFKVESFGDCTFIPTANERVVADTITTAQLVKRTIGEGLQGPTKLRIGELTTAIH